MNKPTRHFRLTCWRLLYHVDVQKTLDRQDEIDACQHSRLQVMAWDAQKALFTREWAKVLAKRQRRLDWFTTHGSVEAGWTPPDPKDPRRTANKPIHAYLARRKLTLKEVNEKNGCIRLKSQRCGRPKINWHLQRRIRAWQRPIT